MEEDNNIFKKIEKIDNIEVLRNLMNYYQNEHSNFISDFNNVNSKISGVCNLAAIFLGFFLTIAIFLYESGYTKFSHCWKIILLILFIVFMIFLITFIGYTFWRQKFQKGYMKILVDFPILEAYESKYFWAHNNEKEFLCQMIYNLHKNNKINDKKLNKLTRTLPFLHNYFISIISVIIICIVGIIATGK